MLYGSEMGAIDLEKLGNRLRALRKLRGLTQTEVAARMGVSKQQANHWEQGRSALTLDHLINLATEYKISVGEILSERAISDIVGSVPVTGTPVPLYSETELRDLSASSLAQKEPKTRVFSKNKCSRDAIAFHIFDRAMSPLFIPNDLVVVDPSVAPEPGDCVAVALPVDRRLFFRRFRPTSESPQVKPPFTLRAENPDYEARTVTKENHPMFLGTLVEHTRFGPRG